MTTLGQGSSGYSVPGASGSSPAAETDAVVSEATAGEALSAAVPVRFDTTGTPGELLRAQATTIPTADVVGVVKTGVSAGATATFYTAGQVPVRFAAAPAATSNGARVYLDASTPGRATLTQPSAGGTSAVLIGWLTGADGATVTPNVLLKLDYLFLTPA